MTRPVTIACCQYPIEPVGSLTAWKAKLDQLIAAAVADEARLCLFPEYAAMELTSALPGGHQDVSALDAAATRTALAAQLIALQALVADAHDALSTLARRHRVWLVGPSLPVAVGDGYCNRATIVAPTGDATFVEKQQMTRFERELWGVSSGQRQVVVEAEFGRFAVAICYDAEFPLVGRRLAEAGAEMLLVPSCTDALTGYHRVRVGCAARALENQMIVASAPTVGRANWSLAIDCNVGAAHVFGPPDRGFPNDGAIATGQLDRPGWLTSTVDLDQVDRVRRGGEVLGFRDWNASAPPNDSPVAHWP